MKIIVKKFFTSVFTISMLFFLQNAICQDDEDWQLWTAAGLEYKLRNGITSKFIQEFRFQDDMCDHSQYFSDIGIKFDINKWLDLSANFRIHNTKKSDDDWQKEYRPYIAAILKWGFPFLEFSDRNRVEVRDKDIDVRTYANYRNKLTIKTVNKWTPIELQPYIADEIYYDLPDGELNQNRVFIGVKSGFCEFLKGDFYYLWKTSEKNEEWIDNNVIRFEIIVSF